MALVWKESQWIEKGKQSAICSVVSNTQYHSIKAILFDLFITLFPVVSSTHDLFLVCIFNTHTHSHEANTQNTNSFY